MKLQKPNKMKHLLLTLALLGTFSITQAQENVFLQRAFWKGNPTIDAVEKAIAAGNDATQLNSNMFDGVCYAILEQADNATIQHLIAKKGNEVDKLTHDGRTYIFWAAYRGNLELVAWLLEQGARADIEDAHGNSVINFAANSGMSNTAIYDLLLVNKANINATTRSGANALLLIASGAEDMGILNYFMDKGLSFESLDEQENGIFQYAAKGGNLNVLKALQEKGAPVKLTNKKGENALFMAAQGTRSKQHTKEVFAYLEGLGLDASIVSTENKNLLHLLANRNQNLSVFEHYLDKGLDANAQDASGNTPIRIAARGNSLEVLQQLMHAAEDINVKDNKGQSALAIAVAYNTPEVVALFLENGAEITGTDTSGNGLAYYLMESYDAKNPEAFEAKWKLLESAGVAMEAKQHDGNTLVHLAAKENNRPLLERLKDIGVDINAKNDEGNTPLHLAAMSTGSTSILKYLVAQGADVNLKTDFEETAFDLASENELLQQQGESLDFLTLAKK